MLSPDTTPVDMELSDPELLSSLLLEDQRPRRSSNHRGSPQGPKTMTRSSPARRCRCGTCPRCIDNARWDRIFRQKFADPNYYEPKPVAFGSTLGWLR